MKVIYIGGSPLPFLEVGRVFDVLDTESTLILISAGWFDRKFFEVKEDANIQR